MTDSLTLPKTFEPANNQNLTKQMLKIFIIVQTLVNIEISTLILALYYFISWDIETILLIILPLTYPLTYWQQLYLIRYRKKRITIHKRTK